MSENVKANAKFSVSTLQLTLAADCNALFLAAFIFFQPDSAPARLQWATVLTLSARANGLQTTLLDDRAWGAMLECLYAIISFSLYHELKDDWQTAVTAEWDELLQDSIRPCMRTAEL